MRATFRAVLPIAVSLGATSGCSSLLKADDTTFAPDTHADAAAEALAAPDWSAPVRFASPSEKFGTGFGAAVAIYGDVLAVTAPEDEVTKNGAVLSVAGAIYLFDLANAGATPTKVVAPNADAGDGVYSSDVLPSDATKPPGEVPAIAVAIDDTSLIEGMASEDSGSDDINDNGTPEAGAVFIYDRSDLTKWQYLKASSIEENAVFGQSLSLSGDLLAVGAPGEQDKQGAVYVFRRGTDGRFVNDAPPVWSPVPHPGAWFGTSVSISENRLVVGAASEDTGGSGVHTDTGDPSAKPSLNSGAAYVFTRSDAGGWAFERYLKPLVNEPTLGPATGFGMAVAQSDSLIVIGAPSAPGCSHDEATGSNRGAAFLVDTVSWSEQCVNPLTRAESVLFGFAVGALGESAFIGAPWDPSLTAGHPRDDHGFNVGAAYTFAPGGAKFVARDYAKAPGVPNAATFATSLAVERGRIAIGAPYEQPRAGDPSLSPPDGAPAILGAAYVFQLDN